jgi:protein tyrosine phosphatase
LQSSQQALYNSQPSLVADALLQQQQNQLQQHHFNLASSIDQQQHREQTLAQQYQLRSQALNLQQLQQVNVVEQQNVYSSTPDIRNLGNSVLTQHALQHQQSYPPNQHHQHQQQQFHNNDATNEQIVAELQRLNLYKPPPPYPGPYAKLASTSTPDLAGANLNYSSVGGGVIGMGGSSPDLVSRRNLPPYVEGGLHRTFDNLNNMSSATPASNDYRNAYSTEELNNATVYQLESSRSQQQQQRSTNLSHHDTSNLVTANYSRKVSTDSTNFVSAQLTQLSCNEPIYQNQQQLAAAAAAAAAAIGSQEAEDGSEPIYQNLPVHEKILYKQRLLRQKQQERERELEEELATMDDSANDSIHIDETVESVDPVNNPLLKRHILEIQQQQLVTTAASPTTAPSFTTVSKLKGHVSRVAITNSRENLHSDEASFVPAPELQQLPKKSVTKISIGGGSGVSEVVAPPLSSGSEERKISKTSSESSTNEVRRRRETNEDLITKNNNLINSEMYVATTPSSQRRPQQDREKHHYPTMEQKQTPRTPSSKPRAGRKRWALNFGSKTGSLKSIKSESGSHKSHDSFDGSSSTSAGGRGFGPMMLATLHGLTRSRPDLLAESMATFSKPSKMPKDEIGAYLEAKLEEGEVMREFECVHKKKLDDCHFNTAVMAENIPRSRFKDVLPYEENRVRLTAPDKDNKTGFINASHISASIGPNAQRFYIAAQGPMANTVLHFWQMVLQCDVHLIVMLTDASTSTKTSSCIPYWPTKSGSTVELGDFKIVNKFSSGSGDEDDPAYTTSTLHVTHTPSKRSRTIWHLQYADWSDHGCPSDVKKYIEFLGEMSALRQHTSTEIPSGQNRNPPVLVHCSAGVGRSGVTLLSDILLYCVDHNLDIDIPKVLTHLRQQRMLMVQTVAQYKFVHTVLIQYLKQSRLI